MPIFRYYWTPKDPLFTIGIFFTIFGLLFTTISSVIFISTITFLQTAHSTSGQVVDIIRRTDSDGDVTYSPLIQFTLPNHQIITHQSNFSSGINSYQKNQSVPVLYNPANPSQSKINSFTELYLLPLLFFSFGIVFTLIGLPLFISQHKKRQYAKTLPHTGLKIYCPISQIHTANFRVNHQPAYYLTCSWTDSQTNLSREFASEYLWQRPPDSVIGQKVTVFINPKDSSQYWIDPSSVPSK